MTRDEVDAAAGEVRVRAALVRECALSLRRQHLVWWEGQAAEEYARRVRDRAARLEQLAEALDAMAALLDHLAALLGAAPSGVAAGRAGWALPA